MEIPAIRNPETVSSIILPDPALDPIADNGITDFSRNRNADAGRARLTVFINQHKPRTVNRLSRGIKIDEFVAFENSGGFGKCKGLQQNEMAAIDWRIKERSPDLVSKIFLNRQSFPAFGPSAVNQFPALLGGHTR
jgi:hypothetical protein